ncbi:MAG: SDR family NAD(P)-dependent oxidoreductase [Nitriliruptorales bacterium]|nr:SDR family NAD(P)-dependent oxidoreductase [Nitriliruptorales bacterium]
MSPSDRPLADKACLITGGSSGLGRSTGSAMAAAGASVALVARSADDLAHVAESTAAEGSRVIPIAADLADPTACQDVVQRTVQQLGRLDIVVNAAGTDVPKAAAELEAHEWDRVLAVNLRAPFLIAKHSFPHLRNAGGGTIINISSVAGRRGWAGASAYCAAKFGLTGLTQALNAEGKPHGIRVCVVYPGAMDTQWGDWSADERRRHVHSSGRSEPSQALPPGHVADLLVWIARAPAALVLNESTVTPLHEQGWP